MTDTLHPNLYPAPITYEGRRLEGKVVIIFGASSGIGALSVRALALAGHTVYAGIRRIATVIKEAL